MTRRVNLVVAVVLASMLLVPLAAHEFTDWSAPVSLGPVVNSAFGDFHACLSKDGLSLYFTSARPGGYGGWDIYVTQRASVTNPWGPPQNLGPTINTSANEGAPFLSTDGHRMYFQSDAPGGFGLNDIYVSRRHDRRDDFGWLPAVNLGSGVNSDANEATPAIYAEETTGLVSIYFASDRPGGQGGSVANGQGNDIWVSTMRDWDETFGPASPVVELNSTSAERAPYVSRDGLEMYLTSDRPGGFGQLDLWVATRSTRFDTWSAPVNLGPDVNSALPDARPALSFDGTLLFFQSTRSGTLGSYDLYVAERTKLRGKR